MSFRDNERTPADDSDTPSWVRGKNKAPDALGGDDLAWAMASQIVKKFYDEGVPTGKSEAWFYYRVKSGLDKYDLRGAYSRHPEEFRDGQGRRILLPDFGRKVVNYYFRRSPWQYESSIEGVIGDLCDPQTLIQCSKGLRRHYSDLRAKSRRD
jgi:hypothetical protein